MGRLARLGSVLLAALLAPAPVSAEMLARWTQYVASGGVEIRVITDEASCPAAIVDGRSMAMIERAAPDDAFAVRVCALPLPEGAATATIAGEAHPVPGRRLDRIVVIGDTGCRIEAKDVQGCDDPAAWPFARIARAAAEERPDLVIHVGDYYYREDPCPASAAACAGSPHGDVWATWAADFFTPAAPLLAAAPHVLVRGNHEICQRGGLGWTRLLAPVPYDRAAFCVFHHPPFLLALPGLRLAVTDTAVPPDGKVLPALAALYRDELAWVARAAGEAPTWLLTHKPLWGVAEDDEGHLVGPSQTLAAASGGLLPPALELAISGHIHLLQALAFEGGEPPQLVVGTGGTELDELFSRDVSGLLLGGRIRIARGLSLRAFGFMVLDRRAQGWRGRVLGVDGALLATCMIAGRDLACEAAAPLAGEPPATGRRP